MDVSETMRVALASRVGLGNRLISTAGRGIGDVAYEVYEAVVQALFKMGVSRREV
jgi:hypothetical protein